MCCSSFVQLSTALHCVARLPLDIETLTIRHRDLERCYRSFPFVPSKFPRGWRHRTGPSHRVPIAIFRSKISNQTKNKRDVSVKDLDREGEALRLFEDLCAISIRNERAMVAMAALLTLLVTSCILWKLLPRYVQRGGGTGRTDVVRRWTKLEGAQRMAFELRHLSGATFVSRVEGWGT